MIPVGFLLTGIILKKMLPLQNNEILNTLAVLKHIFSEILLHQRSASTSLIYFFGKKIQKKDSTYVFRIIYGLLKVLLRFMLILNYSQTYPCGRLYKAVTCIKRSPFLVLLWIISLELNLF